MAARQRSPISARSITHGISSVSRADQAVAQRLRLRRDRPLSYGTETGSSVRRPASYCGITGFKPTFGIISRHGSFRGAWSQDHVGLFARSAKDIALGLDPVAGFDPRDPASVRQDNPGYASRLDANAKGLRVGVLRRFLEGVNPAVRQAFDAALKVLASEGCEIVDLDFPRSATLR